MAGVIVIDGFTHDLDELRGHAQKVVEDPASNQVEQGLAIVVVELITEVLDLREKVAEAQQDPF